MGEGLDTQLLRKGEVQLRAGQGVDHGVVAAVGRQRGPTAQPPEAQGVRRVVLVLAEGAVPEPEGVDGGDVDPHPVQPGDGDGEEADLHRRVMRQQHPAREPVEHDVQRLLQGHPQGEELVVGQLVDDRRLPDALPRVDEQVRRGAQRDGEALDVDGVMTDGIIYYSPSGDAMKGFSARDGMGISLIRAAGIQTALVTGRRSPMVEQRAKDLHIDYVLQDCSRKLLAMQQLCSEIGLSLDEVAYMGDDLNDVELIANAGFGAAPLDACEEARRSAAFVSAYPGGHGALREFAEYILKSQHVWDKVLRQYFGDATFTLRQ